jgi:heptose II phosphotransferase
LKDDHRSRVTLLTIDGVDYISKDFVLQRTWWWFKMISLLFPTIGQIACRNALGLAKAGLLTPPPLYLLQKQRFGMVVESRLIYPYMQGSPATESDAQEIVSFVSRMHEAGWIHRDPHPANFIRTDEGLATLDPIKARRSRSLYRQAYDVMLLEHDLRDAPKLYGVGRLGGYFALAKAGHDFIRFYRRVKKNLRRGVGLKGNSGTLTK